MRSFARWILPLLALAGCEVFAFADKDRIPGQGGTGGTGGSASVTGGGGSATGGTGNGGGGVATCLHDFDCPGVDAACHVRVCESGVCGWKDLAEGTPTPAQVAGDCKKRICDGKGGVKQVDDDADLLDDHNGCTLDACVSGTPQNVPYVASPCGIDKAGVCDGSGSCVACVTGAQCTGGKLCFDNRCVPPTCLDHQRDGDETATDCGGASCAPCGTGRPCLRDRDCTSGICSASTKLCQAPSCADGKRNGDEADVDCGGSCPKRCEAGKHCAVGDDCVGGTCSGALCLPSCHDGVKNGAETGLDCGGYACGPCHDGQGCEVGGDCLSGVCQDQRCVPAECVDGQKNGAESDVDCGGPCAPCAPGKGCAKGADCTSQVCAGTICAKATCSDHVRNASETGVDCGGPSCGKCADGQGCAAATDCTSNVCSAGACVEPSCSDGVKDQNETDTDCGGGCAGCGAGMACSADGDCASLLCNAGFCKASACDDKLQNGDETDVDCGGSACPPCPIGKGCGIPADCETIACDGTLCVPPTCSDHVRNGNETGVDCGGPDCSACPGGQGCLGDGDCASGKCNAGVCAASCTDHLQDGDETAVDCGGSCPGCDPGLPCNVDGDCSSKICHLGFCLPPSCTDMVKNGKESDVDCGGPDCPQCVAGAICNANSDCETNGCINNLCEEVLLVSEVRTNGPDGDKFGDDFVELYNPGNATIHFDASWQLWHKSAQSACQGKVLRYQGKGQLIPPHHHFLLVGLSYSGPPGDDLFMNVDPTQSIADSASLWILHNNVRVEALCYYYDAITLSRLTGACMIPYECQGTPVNNFPHIGTTDPGSTIDQSIERRPGGAAGNGQSTGDNASDFHSLFPANPQNLSDPPTP
jgi:hypothetical protein